MKRKKLVMHDFDFARLMNTGYEDDITEWFSDHDIHLADIVQERDVLTVSAAETSSKMIR